MRKLNISHRFRASARAGATAILAVGLFTSSPYTNGAHAIDLSPTVSDAALDFGDFQMVQNQTVLICAHNYNKTNVDVVFVIATQYAVPYQFPLKTAGTNFTDNSVCVSIDSGNESGVRSAAIVLKSPAECSQATEYPGKCRVVGSLEIYGGISNDSPVRHLDPVLLPAPPPRPQIIVPLQR